MNQAFPASGNLFTPLPTVPWAASPSKTSGASWIWKVAGLKGGKAWAEGFPLSKKLSTQHSYKNCTRRELMAEEETEDPRYAFEECDGHRIKYYAGQPGKYVGVTKKTRKSGKVVFEARACVTKYKGNGRRQYGVGTFGSAVAAAIAIAQAEADPLGPRSPEAERKPRTCALPAACHLP